MKVWWCLEHETSGHPPRCWKQLMTHAYGDCRQVEMQLVPADAETDFSLSNSSVVAPGQRLSEHLSQPERSSTEGRQLVPADARVVSGENGQKVWWCEYRFRVEDIPNDLRTCHDLRYRRDARREDHVGCGVAWLTVETPKEPPKDPWDYDP